MSVDYEDIRDIKDDIKSIAQDMNEMRVWLARNTESLETHIKRTDLLEQKVDMLDDHVAFMKSMNKIFAVAGTIITTVISLYLAYKGIAK